MNIKAEPLGKQVTSDTIVGQGPCSVLFSCVPLKASFVSFCLSFGDIYLKYNRESKCVSAIFEDEGTFWEVPGLSRVLVF